MRKFPTLCVDDFYKNPDAVRKFALEQDFCNRSNAWPGKRTKHLHEIDSHFFDTFCEKLFSLYYEFESRVEWTVLTTFQLVPPFSSDEQSSKNLGFVHRDNYDKDGLGIIYAGIIYLTPGINKNCGTSIFKMKKNLFREDDTSLVKENFYGEGIDTGFDEYMNSERERFEETIRFYNHYNRMVSFDASTYHGVNSFYSDGELRLTQPFFVCDVKSNSGFPLERSDRRNSL
jgi:hypothetical protein